MGFASQAGSNFNEAIRVWGQPVRFKYLTAVYPGAGSYYDDDLTMTQSGADLWTSGIAQPIHDPSGSNERVLLQQGKILINDTRLYIPGNIDTGTGAASGTIQFRIGIGSPPVNEYALTEAGVLTWSPEGSPVYKKCYLRVLPTGSLSEE